ncbi:MAG TPA: hypothetical protein VHR86_02935 [Armatimonadota bacterium]|nr:hypothetical protein [Armatimonadota bacterium]
MARFQDFKRNTHSPVHINHSPHSPNSIHGSSASPAPDHAFPSTTQSSPALVVFALGNSGSGYTYSAHIVWILLGRREQYREIGWLDDFHIGVLLPGSTLTDALRFAESIRREIPERVPLRYRVYCAPFPRRHARGERSGDTGSHEDTEVRFTPSARLYRSETEPDPVPDLSAV